MRLEALDQGWIDISETDCLCERCAITHEGPKSVSHLKIHEHETESKRRFELQKIRSDEKS